MNQIFASIIAVILLFLIFIVSFDSAYKQDINTICQNDTICIIDIVKETQNFSLCNFSKNTSQCYKISSINLKNKELCEYAQNTTDCYYSYALKMRDVSVCENVSNLNDRCIFEIAVLENQSQICQKSQDVDYCYYSYAVEKSDLLLCNQSERYKNTCVSKILGDEILE